MKTIQIKEIKEEKEKIWIMKECDIAFEKSIYMTERGQKSIKKICSNGIFLAAFYNEKICGFLAMYANDVINYLGYISIFAILPEMQHKGIGCHLLEKSLQIASDKNMCYMKLEVLNNNKKAINFYTKNKFIKESDSSEDSIYMIRKLK